MKKFNYYGQEITVPDYANYVATDKDGNCWWYIKKPLLVQGGFSSGGNCGRVNALLNIKSWRGSLRKC